MRKVAYVVGAMCCMVLFSCCDDTTAPDPCSGSEPVTARFTMYETLGGKTVAADTVLTWNTVVFATDRKYDSYEWQIGSDARVWRDSLVRLRFEQAEGDVPVILIVRSTPNSGCFPNDDGVDTLRKILHVAGDWETTRAKGSYHGHNTDAPQKSFTFSLEHRDLGNFGRRFVMNNLNPGCTDPPPGGGPQIDIAIGYRSFQFSSTGWVGMGCDDPDGVAVLHGDGDSIVVQYTLIDRNDIAKRIPKTFVGKRVH